MRIDIYELNAKTRSISKKIYKYEKQLTLIQSICHNLYLRETTWVVVTFSVFLPALCFRFLFV